MSTEDPRREPGLGSARQFMILATMLYRISHLMIGLFVVGKSHAHSVLPWVVFAAAVSTSALVYGTAVSRGRFVAGLVWMDVLVSGCFLPFAVYAWGGPHPAAAFGWVMLLGTSAASAVAVAFEEVWIVCAVALLTAAQIWYQAVGQAGEPPGSHLVSLVSSALTVRILWWYLRRQGRLLDAESERAIAAEARRARYAERLEHHRALHDTVLATLTAIAGGGVDANAPQVRERCAREAAYLRRLIQWTGDADHRPQIGAALEQAVRSAESLDLRVTAQYHELPQVPSEVAAALADAVTEALNNVRRHAGTGHAFLTAAGDSDHVVVTVVDRGRGFDPERTAHGLGLSRSVYARLREVGGRAGVDSAPGEGAQVELRWPA